VNMKQLSNLLRAEVIRLRHGDDSGLDHTRRRSTFVYQSKRGNRILC
jgi:hypothetical protein